MRLHEAISKRAPRRNVPREQAVSTLSQWFIQKLEQRYAEYQDRPMDKKDDLDKLDYFDEMIRRPGELQHSFRYDIDMLFLEVRQHMYKTYFNKELKK